MQGRDGTRDKWRLAALAGFAIALSVASIGCGSVAGKSEDGSAAGGARADGSTGAGGSTATGGAAGTGGADGTGGSAGTGGAVGTGGALGKDAATDAPSV